jgi:hypothetical protein
MKLALHFFLAIIPGGISVLFVYVNKNKLDIIFSKYINKYDNKQFSNIPFRVLRMIKNFNLLNKGEKSLLIWSLFFILIFYLSFAIWAVIILFFPEIFFSS